MRVASTLWLLRLALKRVCLFMIWLSISQIYMWNAALASSLLFPGFLCISLITFIFQAISFMWSRVWLEAAGWTMNLYNNKTFISEKKETHIYTWKAIYFPYVYLLQKSSFGSVPALITREWVLPTRTAPKIFRWIQVKWWSWVFPFCWFKKCHQFSVISAVGKYYISWAAQCGNCLSTCCWAVNCFLLL